jgi:hypothetical protein
MKHPIDIKGFDTMKELATDIGNLEYETLQEFLKELGAKINDDAERDESAGKEELAGELYNLGEMINDIADSLEGTIEICKPYQDA